MSGKISKITVKNVVKHIPNKGTLVWEWTFGGVGVGGGAWWLSIFNNIYGIYVLIFFIKAYFVGLT